MKRNCSKILSFVLTISMVLSNCPTNLVFAKDADTTEVVSTESTSELSTDLNSVTIQEVSTEDTSTTVEKVTTQEQEVKTEASTEETTTEVTTEKVTTQEPTTEVGTTETTTEVTTTETTTQEATTEKATEESTTEKELNWVEKIQQKVVKYQEMSDADKRSFFKETLTNVEYKEWFKKLSREEIKSFFGVDKEQFQKDNIKLLLEDVKPEDYLEDLDEDDIEAVFGLSTDDYIQYFPELIEQSEASLASTCPDNIDYTYYLANGKTLKVHVVSATNPAYATLTYGGVNTIAFCVAPDWASPFSDGYSGTQYCIKDKNGNYRSASSNYYIYGSEVNSTMRKQFMYAIWNQTKGDHIANLSKSSINSLHRNMYGKANAIPSKSDFCLSASPKITYNKTNKINESNVMTVKTGTDYISAYLHFTTSESGAGLKIYTVDAKGNTTALKNDSVVKSGTKIKFTVASGYEGKVGIEMSPRLTSNTKNAAYYITDIKVICTKEVLTAANKAGSFNIKAPQALAFPLEDSKSVSYSAKVPAFGSFTLVKTLTKKQEENMKDSGYTLARAKFYVYSDKAHKNLVGKFETDSDGHGHVISNSYDASGICGKTCKDSNDNGDYVKKGNHHTIFNCPAGTYYIVEKVAPYKIIDGKRVYYFGIAKTKEVTVKANGVGQVVEISEASKSGTIGLKKKSNCPNVTTGNRMYNMDGICYNIYQCKSLDSKTVDTSVGDKGLIGVWQIKAEPGDSSANGKVLYNIYDSDGQGLYCMHNLPINKQYMIQEDAYSVDPDCGYLVDKNKYYVKVEDSDAGTTLYVGNKEDEDGNKYVGEDIANDPVPVSLVKQDKDGNPVENSKDTKSLEGAIFEMCYYDSYDTNSTPLKTWYFKTTKSTISDRYRFSYAPNWLVSSWDGNKSDTLFSVDGVYGLPLGSFTIREVEAPEGYTTENSIVKIGNNVVSDGVIEGRIITDSNGDLDCTISGLSVSNVSLVMDEQSVRGDIAFSKINFKTRESMAGIPFRITKINADGTDGESHVVVTDQNGNYRTESGFIPHTKDTNGNDNTTQYSPKGVWFGDITKVNNEVGALDYGTYRLDEIRCEANKGLQLETGITFTIENHGTTEVLGTVSNVPEPVISTTAENADDRTKLIYDKENATIIDHVDYKYLTVNTSYQLEGELRIKDGTTTGKSIGVKSTSEVFKTPSEYKESKHEICGNKDITFKFNASQYEGKEFVVFEKLYKIKSNGTKELVASHEEINDEGQTIYLPKISTTATNKSTKNHMAYADGEVTINDEVTITSINPKLQYVVKGTVMDKSTGEALLVNGKQITANVNIPTEDLKIVTSDNNASTITVPVEYTFDATGLKGKDVVIYEYLYVNGSDKVIASHEDITDMNQTIHFPSLKTKVVNDATETNMCSLEGITNITDTVTYAGLLAGEYTMKGKVYDPLTNKPLLIDGKEVTGETNFTVDSYISDDVEVKFSFEGKGLNGRKFVVFEELYQGDKLIADHSDISDTDQTFKFPDVGTKATDGITNNHIGFVTGKATINDEVAYSNLIPGKEYTISGYLMDKDTEKPFLINGKKVESSTTFTAEKEEGTVTITYEFDASALQGKTIVVFEDLYYKKIHVVSHADINDKDQTVKYPKLTTTAKSTDTEERLVIPNKKVTVVDTVKYENVLVGETYDVTGYLMVQGTNSPLLVNGKKIEAKGTFKAKAESGTIDLTYKFDGTGLEGQSVVVFENLYLGEAQVAKHEDITDEGQTIHFPKIGTTAKDGKTKTHTGNATTDATIVDTVKYENLVVGKKYTVSGYLMVKDTNKPFLINGKKVTASTTFIAESANGTVDLTYKFDATALRGKDVVVFEDVYYKDTKVATHADINDEDQTIKYPSIKTTATCDGSKQVVRKTAVKITDKVAYENLVKGSKYTMKGILMDKVTGEELDVSGEVETELEFTAKGNDGEVNMVYTIDTTNINKTDIVVFEYLYDENGKLIASHEDINDEDQTVHVPKLPPEDTPKTGDNSPVVPVIIVGLASFLGLGIIMFLKRRKKDA